MKKKTRRRRSSSKDAGRIFLVCAVQSVLMLSVSVLFFISGTVFQNEELKEELKTLIRGEDALTAKVSHLQKENEGSFKEKILGRAIFTSAGFEPVKIDGNITSPFGMRINPILKKKEFHTGMDIRAGEGKLVRTSFPGICRTCSENKTDGKFVVMHHGNFDTKYCHLSEILISEGMKMREGEALGKAGMTGLATGPHLHFEIIKDGKYIDPESAFASPLKTYEI